MRLANRMLIALAAVTLAVGVPIAAQDAPKKPTRQQELARLIGENQQTLAKAIEASEKLTGGVAISARADLRDEKLGFTVTCVVDGKPVDVKVDGKTGEASSGGKRSTREEPRDQPREKPAPSGRDGKQAPGEPVEP